MTAARPLPFPPRRARRPNPPPVSPLTIAAMVGLSVSVAISLMRWWWSTRDRDVEADSHEMMRAWLTMQPPVTTPSVPTVPSMQSTPTVVAAQTQGQLDALRMRLDQIEQRLSSGAGSSFADRSERLRRLLSEDGGRD